MTYNINRQDIELKHNSVGEIVVIKHGGLGELVVLKHSRLGKILVIKPKTNTSTALHTR